MKRVLCILSSMNAGGAETFLMKIYRALDKSRYQMDFCINVKEKCFYEDEITALGGKIFRIPSKSENLKEFKKQLAALVKDQKYKYVLRITSSAMGFMDLKIAKKAGAVVCIARSSNASDGGGFKANVAHCAGRALYGQYVDVKIAPSDLAAIYTFGKRAYENGTVKILHNAIDTDLFRYEKEKRKRIWDELGISEKALVVGHIGRFSKQKNHGYLIDIFAELKKQKEDAVLLLVGTGELQDDVRRKVHECRLDKDVIFAGVRSDIPALLSAMDVFVFPSLYEGMPNTVIEAQATGLPCLIADTITREADITGLVEYLPITENVNLWAGKILGAACVRFSQKEAFQQQHYDIRSTVADFTNFIFQE